MEFLTSMGLNDFLAELILMGDIDAGSMNIPTASADQVVAGVLNTVYMIGGITAVITIIIAGYLYSISDGKPDHTAAAKNTIIYALIGLIVIGSAFVITQFIIGRF